MCVRRQSYLTKFFPFDLLIFFSYCTSDCSNKIYFASVINASVRLGLFDKLFKNVCIQVIDWTEWAFVLKPINNGFFLIYIVYRCILNGFFFISVTKLRWLIKAMREKNIFCSLNIISCSHNLSFCYHKKDILFLQRIILFPQYITLASVVCLPVRTSLTVHSKTFSETTGPIRTKLGKHSSWVVPLINCVQQVQLIQIETTLL
jgi:hypothetical protein